MNNRNYLSRLLVMLIFFFHMIFTSSISFGADGASYSISIVVSADRKHIAIYRLLAKDVEELKEGLHDHNVPDNISLCWNFMDVDTSCEYERIGISTLTSDQFEWLVAAALESRFVLVSNFED